MDSSGNLYIADTHNHRIRMVAAGTGVISTVAGIGAPGFSGDEGPAIAAQLNVPTALTVDKNGNLDIADTNNHRIRQLNPSTGIIRTVSGGMGPKPTQAMVPRPLLLLSIRQPALAVDASGNLYVADTHNHRVRRVNANDGVIATVAGGGLSVVGNL